MKKIIFVLPTLQGGGAEKVISSLALSFDKKKKWQFSFSNVQTISQSQSVDELLD